MPPAPAGKGSSSSGQASKAKESPDAETPPTQPVSTFRTPQAEASRHVHTVLLPTLFLLRFNALVADPTATMWSALPIVLAIQAAYTVTCLPAVGSRTVIKKLRPGEKKKAGAEGVGPSIAVTSLLALVLSGIGGAVLHVVLVLFGAPFLTHLPHTFLCSLHLSILGFFPLFYTRGVTNNDWLDILGARAPFDEAFGGLVGACVGAWLGAVPIPLDWDREWQKWPVTILCGIYAGYTVGKLIGGTVAFGKRFG